MTTRSKGIDVLAIFFVIALFSLGWFKGADFIVGGDGSWPVKFSEYFESNKVLWMDTSTPGHVKAQQLANAFPLGLYGALFEKVGVTSSSFQRIVYFLSFFFSGWGAYLLLEKLTKSQLGGLVGGLFYMLSPYALLVVWNPSYGRNFPLYTFLPICLFLLSNYLDKDRGYFSKYYFVAVLGTFFSLIGASFNNPAFFVLFLTVVGFFIAVTVVALSKGLRTAAVTKGAIFLTTIILLNSFWLGPFATNFGAAFQLADNEVGGLIDDSETRELNSVFVKDALRGSGLWTMFAGHKNEPYYVFYEYWRGALYAFTSFSFVLFAIYGVLKNKTKSSTLYLLLFSLGVLLNSGVRWEMGADLVEFLYSAPFIGRAFRSVYLKLGILLILPLAYLVSHAVTSLSGKAKRIVLVLILGAIFVNSIPFFSGKIIKPHGRLLAGYAATYPEEYYELADYFSEGQKVKRILSLPHPRTYNYSFRWEDGAFNSVYLVWSLIDDPLLFMGTHNELSDLNLGFNEEWLDENSIGYILIHKDIATEDLSYYLPENFPEYINDLILNYESSVVMNNRYFLLLEPPYDTTREIVYSEDVDGNTIPVRDLKRVNAAKYSFNVNPKEISKIYLNDTYDPTWKLSSVQLDSEFVHSSLSPISWAISSLENEEDVSFEINLTRQDSAEKWWVVSYLTLLVLLLGFSSVVIRKEF